VGGHAWLSDIGLVNCMSVCLSTHPHEQTNFKIQKIALWRCSWILVPKDKVWKKELAHLIAAYGKEVL